MTEQDYGIQPLQDTPNPAERLYEEILAKLGRHPRWERQRLVMASQLAKETGLARGTVTRALLRLVSDGVLQPHHGKGYRVIDVAPPRLVTSVVSVSEFCEDARLECVSVLDHDACRSCSLSSISGDTASEELKALIRNRLRMEANDSVLLLRRARAVRQRGARTALTWAILETLFLVEARLPRLEGAATAALRPISSKTPTGNLSLHRWMNSQGIRLSRSEYSLRLASLSGRDATVWESLTPRAHIRASDPFLRLEAVTYGNNLEPLLFTREHLVPDVFDLGVSGFRFQLGRSFPSSDTT